MKEACLKGRKGKFSTFLTLLLVCSCYCCYLYFISLKWRENPNNDKRSLKTQNHTSESVKLRVPNSKELLSWMDSMAFIHSDLSRSSAVNDNARSFLVIFPYSAKEKKIHRELKGKDKLALWKLSDFLRSMKQFHGATCIMGQQAKSPKIEIAGNISLDTSWCRFITRKWSVHIRNTGPVENLKLPTTDALIQTCNIVRGPFVIRKDIFQKLGGLLDGFGKLTLLEFFLRSKGELKMAKLDACAWTHEIARTDRGSLEGSKEVSEYAAFANKHNVLRIVTDNRIEWTACVANWELCPEKPYVKPRGLPNVAAPICCSTVLWKMLKDFTRGLNTLGVEYRIVYGTLIGAVRSKAIIPWTYDIDIALPKSAYSNASIYSALQKVLENQYEIGMSFMNMPRGHILVASYIDVNTAPYFDGPGDLEGKALFSSEIEKAVKGMLPVSMSWRERGYVDFYPADNQWLEGSSFVTINNEQFVTVKEVDKLLTNWYGKNYRQPAHKGKWWGLSDYNGPPVN